MIHFKPLQVFAIAIVTLFVASCGGGNTYVADIGTGGTGVASGSISGFGSVYVNGVKHKTSTAKITDDDVEDNVIISEDKLKVGQVVEIKGRAEDSRNSVAEIMEKAAEVKGPVDSVYDAASKTIKVMGQTVLIDNNTSIDNNLGANGVSDLKVGDLVEAHGFRNAAGVIVATRIERQGPIAQYRVRGFISGLDTTKKEFKIGDLVVDYGSAQIVPTGAILADGLRVGVKAQNAPDATTGKLTAIKVKVKKAEDVGRSELEGVITKFTSATDFEINGIKVTTSASTVYEHGTAADLKEGARVEAKGAVTNGVLTATRIEFQSRGDNLNQDSSRIRLSGLVAASSATDKTVTILGQKFIVNDATRFEDRVADTRPFNIANFDTLVKAGAHVQVIAYKRGADLIATRVEVNNATGAFVQGALGPGATASSTSLLIQGVNVKIDSGTKFYAGDERHGGAIADLAAFLAKAPAGTIVKAKSKATPLAGDTSIDATGANQGELETED
ncbi:MAG: DUF5666 domain-containing protein [Burkholderiales bacterium]